METLTYHSLHGMLACHAPLHPVNDQSAGQALGAFQPGNPWQWGVIPLGVVVEPGGYWHAYGVPVVTGMPSGMFNVPVSVHDTFTGQPGNLLSSTNVHVHGRSLIVA